MALQVHCLLGRAPTVRGQQLATGLGWLAQSQNQQVEKVMMMTLRMLVMVPTTVTMVMCSQRNT